MARAIGSGLLITREDHMHQLIAILAAAIGFLTGGHTVQLHDAAPPIELNQPAHPAHSAVAAPARTTRRPMDANPPFPIS